MTKEEKLQKEVFTEIEELEKKCFTFKCKPTYQFQSIEFEMTGNGSPEFLEELFSIYNRILEGLIKISPEQQTLVKSSKKPEKPAEELATDKQKEIMTRFGIKFTEKTTKKEANGLISKSIERSRS